MKNYKIVTSIVTLFLIVYTVITRLEISINVSLCMFSISPILVIWMVYTVLKHAPYNGRELQENEEYGYQNG